MKTWGTFVCTGAGSTMIIVSVALLTRQNATMAESVVHSLCYDHHATVQSRFLHSLQRNYCMLLAPAAATWPPFRQTCRIHTCSSGRLHRINKGHACCRIERRQQFVQRRVRLPESADMTAITAKMDNGTLVIDIPKNPDKVQQRQIDVK